MLKIPHQIRRRNRTPRLLLSLCSAIALSATASAADYYITPNGAGSESGADWSNADAFSASTVSGIANSLSAGDTLYFGSGTYHTGAGPIITISSSGSSGSPKRIVGVDTGSGLPRFSGTYDVDDDGVSTDIFLEFSGSTAHWVFKDFSLEEYAFPVRMDASGSTYTLRNNMTFDNVDGENVQDFFQLRNATGITIENCDAIRYTKRGFRYGAYTSYITFDTCTADANGGDDDFPTKSIPAGFKGDDTNYQPDIHDITFIDCIARNNRFQPQTSYWNGDGFASEEATYNLSYTRCFSYNNHDAGWDDKADNATYVGCVSIGSAEGFRYWGNNGVFINCLSAYNKAYGGTNPSIGFWVGKQAQGNIGYAYIYLSTAHNNDEWAVRAFNGGQMTVTDSILSVDGTFTDGGMEQEQSGGSVTLVNTAKYKASASLLPDPQYTAPSATWSGTPANAFDSAVYSPDQGYYSAYTPGATTASISVTDASAGEPSDDGEFRVTVYPAPTSPVTVNLSVGGTATAGSDYATISSSVVVGTSGTATVPVEVTNDSTLESDETVTLTVTSGTGYAVGTPSFASITIVDEDSVTPAITVSVVDGDAGEPYNDGDFRLTAYPVPTSPIQISLSTSGTATSGTDYTAIPSSVTMGTSGTVDVHLDMKNDSALEGDETVVLTATSGTGYVVGSPASATITIVDDEVIPVVNASVVDSTCKEPGNNGKFRLNATPAPGSSITVNISISGTATSGVDFESIPSSYSVPGSGNKTFLIEPIDDSLVEGNETVILTVLPGTGYTVGTSATITLQDND